jgi:hypothetical protein
MCLGVASLITVDQFTSSFHPSSPGAWEPGAQGARAPPPPTQFFQRTKSAFFVMKSALFVQANVAVNTKLTSCPFCLEISIGFKKKFGQKREFRYSTTGKFFSLPIKRRR